MLLSDPAACFGYVYEALLIKLIHAPVEVNARTGRGIHVLPGGVSFKLNLADGCAPVCGVRRLYPQTAAAEVAWFLSGSRDVTWLNHYTKIWDAFVEDPQSSDQEVYGAETAPARIVEAGYGYRWRRHFGRDQLADAVATLGVNPSDRRVYVSAWDPAEDGLGRPSKNVPCPVGFTLSLTHSPNTSGSYEMHSSLFIRSSDVFVGLPYDVMGHAMLMDVLRATLPFPVNLGTMSVHLAHPHLYAVHLEMAGQSLKTVPKYAGVPMLGIRKLGDVTADPDGFVAAYKRRGDDVEWPDYKCKPELVL